MKVRSFLFLVIAMIVSVVSCSNSTASLNSRKENPFADDADRIIKVGALSVNEAKMFVSLDGDQYYLNIPVALDADSPDLDAGISIKVLDLAGVESTGMTTSSSEMITQTTKELRINLGKKYLPALEDLSKLIMNYSINWKSFTLAGKLSLFRISPRIKTQIMGSTQILVGEKSTFRIFVSDILSGNPIISGDPIMHKDLKVGLYNGETLLGEFTGKTDKFGMASIPVEVADSIQGSLKMVVTTETAYGTRSVEGSVTAEKLRKILLTTDKPVYQPGQVIHIRSLSLKLPGKEPMTDSDVVLEIKDPKGNKVFKQKGKTSEFGVFASDFTLANLVTLGKYTISVVADGDVAQEKTVNIEKYVLPKFGIEFTADKGFYMPGETVNGKIDSNYFYGKPVNGGTVHIEIKTFDVSENTVAIIDAVLDKNGRYTFAAALPAYFTGSSLDQGTALAKFEITVTDSANHSQSVIKSIKVVKSPVIMTLVPAAGKLLPGIEQDMFLILTDPSGSPVAGSVTITAENISEKIDTDESGLAQFKMILPENKPLTMKMSYNGKSIENTVSFTKDDSGEFIFLSTQLPIYKVGETMTVDLFTGFDPSVAQPSMLPDRAYLDIVSDGQIRLMKTVEFKEGKGSVDIELDETMGGPLELLAYYLTDEGNIIRSSKAVYVRKTGSLNVKFTTDKTEYKPREVAKAQFEIKNKDGAPVVAALGVAIVDEAVFHVMDFNPGMEQTYFNIENSVMESTYAIYGLSYDDIVTGTEDTAKESEVEKKTEAFFAGNAAGLVHGLEADDYSKPENMFESASSNAAAARANEVFKSLIDSTTYDCSTVKLTQKEINDILAKPENTDPWDNIMSGTPGQSAYDTSTITVISAGSDEIAGTKDDVTVTVKICEMSWENGGGDPTDEGDAGDSGDSGDTGNTGNTGEKSAAKVREWFPETLYYNPQLITDEKGLADIELTMADSITTWRVTALANSTAGDLGSSLDSIKVFQDFFVDIDFPVSLTQNDSVAVPVGIYNYLGEPQTINLEAQSEDWFEMTGNQTISVTVPGNSVSSVYFPIKVKKIGKHTLTVFAYGSKMDDAVKRSVTVLPDGIMQDASVSELLNGNKSAKINIPVDAIPESAELFVKIYPGIMSQAVEGLDSMFQMPYGCFEQTSSATYPNILVLQYMLTTETVTPEIELKARDFISQGYQRLLTYEVTGGGFEWFGAEPAHFVLTAYGLLEFVDMSAVYEVDPDVITRTAAWMASRQEADGSFIPSSGGIAEGAINNFQDSVLRTTAYGVWALSRADKEKTARDKAVTYLESKASSAEDVYTKAMTAIALVKSGGSSTVINKLVGEIIDLKVEDENGSAHWEQTVNTETYSSGDNANLETTALVGLLLLEKGGYSDVADQILAWIVSQKDSFGNWSTTQGTILALRFMIESLNNGTSEADATVKISANGSPEMTVVITPEDSDVLRLIDLKEYLVYGTNNISIQFTGTGSMMYSAAATWYVPGEEETSTGPLTIDVQYDKTQLNVNDTVGVTVNIKNISDAGVSVILASIGIAPGFTLVPDKLDAAVSAGTYLQKYETTPRQIILYINHIGSGNTATFNFDLVADYPMEAATGESSVNPYYNPEQKFNNASQKLTVSE
ncbi:MAG TPA: MG2 domain-containing protein [bacterium]|nr:MG2 domain-containing protein [bacterium]HPS28881.1 MG2 domain-containing protein [bacterium]